MTVNKENVPDNNIPDLTKNLADEKLAKLAELFPGVVTETTDANGRVVRAIDADRLAQEINVAVVEGDDERYQFTWPDKRRAIALANTPVEMALRPCVEESVDWADTENIYIKGDNLDALKILRETYLGRVKMIYIDPPYNTGSDFVYRDDFSMTDEEYREASGQYDEDGGRLFQNTESNGRFHTDWLNMIYPRLRVAKSLLADDGVIFISIDDNEVHNLRKICDEVFGERNFVDTIIWEKRYSPQNAVQWFSESHDFIVVYAKNKMNWFPNLLQRTDEMNARYKNPDNDPRGVWKATDATAQGGHGTPAQFYTLRAPNGKEHHLPAGRCWVYTENVMKDMILDNRVWFGESGNNMPALKRFLSEVKQGIACKTIWNYSEVGHNQEGKKEIKDIFNDVPFDTPKPTRLILRMLRLASVSDSLILDFFSGSATTAHAVMQLNAEDGGRRRFIMVQLPEVCADDSEAAHAGYKTICDIGMERIRRAGKKIREEHPDAKDLDTGFRVFEVATSNMNDVRLTPDELVDSAKQGQKGIFDDQIDNVKADRGPLDLLIQSMLTFGIELSAKIEERTIDGKHVYIVDPETNQLIACFDENITEETIKAIAKMHPVRFVTRDLSMEDDSVSLNFEQLLAAHSPDQKIDWRVI